VNSNLVTGRTRLVNQLYALLPDLPGGARTDVTAAPGARLLAGMRPAGPVESARKRLGRDLLAEIGDVERRITIVTDQIATAVSDTGTSLLAIDGIGPVLAGRLLGRSRRARRFPTAAAFASYAGVAPVEAARGLTTQTLLSAMSAQQAAVETLAGALTDFSTPTPWRRCCVQLPGWASSLAPASWPRSAMTPPDSPPPAGCAPTQGPRL